MLKDLFLPFWVVKVDNESLRARRVRPVVLVKQQEERSGMVCMAEHKPEALIDDPVALFLKVIPWGAVEVRCMREAPGPHVMAGALQELNQPILQDTEGSIFYGTP